MFRLSLLRLYRQKSRPHLNKVVHLLARVPLFSSLGRREKPAASGMTGGSALARSSLLEVRGINSAMRWKSDLAGVRTPAPTLGIR